MTAYMERSTLAKPLTSQDVRLIETHRLEHRFEPRRGDGEAAPVVRDASFGVGPGLTALVGASGAGKTTLLYLLAGIGEATGGEIRVAGRLMAPASAETRARLRREAVSLVPQSAWLLPHLTVAENVALPLWLGGRGSRGAALERAREELAAVALEHLTDRRSADLSAGERARVALARALAADPPVLLVDEPTGNLDDVSRERMIERLEQAAHDRAVLVATHDPVLLDAAGEVFRVEDGELAREPRSPAAPTTPVGASGAAAPAPHPSRGWGWLRLAGLLSRGFRGRLALAVSGVAVVVALLVAATGILAAGEETLVDRFLGDLPAGFLRVEQPSMALGPFQVSLDRFSGTRLDDATVERLGAIPGVARAHPQVMSGFPLTISASLMGQGFRTDAVLEGVTGDWVTADENLPPGSFEWQPPAAGEDPAPIPVVLSDALLALYNSGFAKSHGLPRLSRQSVVGLRLNGRLGDSSFTGPGARQQRTELRIVGFSPRVSPVSLAAPYEAVQYYNRAFGEETTLSSVVLEVGDLERSPEVVRQVGEMGLSVDEGDGLGPRLGRALRFLRQASQWLTLGLLALFAVLAAQLFSALLTVRRRYFDLLQVLGASRGRVLTLLSLEVAGATVLGVLAGLALGVALGTWAGGRLGEWASATLGLPMVSLFQLPDGPVIPVLLALPLLTLLLSLPATLAWLRRPLLERLRGA
jgi:ABC-type lipoprotein export system ATPase subunit